MLKTCQPTIAPIPPMPVDKSKAFPAWRDTTPLRRARILMKVRDLIQDHQDEFAHLRRVLNFLCCAEEYLDDDMMRNYIDKPFVVVPPFLDVAPFVFRESLALVFFACSYSKSASASSPPAAAKPRPQ